jgi:uncharacterized membrane protein
VSNQKKERERTMTDNRVVVGVFADPAQAYQVISDLHQAGFRDEQIGFIVRDELDATAEETQATELLPQESGKGTNQGVVAGGVVGGLAGAAASLLIPGLGPALAGGILATIGGMAVGAAAGGFIGTLVEIGIPEDEARRYDDEVRSGRTIVIVQADDNPMEAFRILKQDHALNSDVSTLQTEEQYDPEATIKLNALGTRTTHATNS